MFRNNGFSEVFWFTYQNNCAAPLGISASVQGQRVAIEWQNNPEHLEWKVEYREKNNVDAQWFSINNTLPRVMLTDLRAGTQYEYRVGGACEVGRFTYSSLLSFTTNGVSVSNLLACGDSTLPAPGGGNILQTLNAGDTLRAGSFTVHVGYATGAGSFSGTGYVIVPWLANAKVEVRFTTITLSEDRKLLSGVIETTYELNEDSFVDLDELLDDLTKLFMEVGNIANEIKSLLEKVQNNQSLTPAEVNNLFNYINTNQSSIVGNIGNSLGSTEQNNASSALNTIQQALDCYKQTTGFVSPNATDLVSRGPSVREAETFVFDCAQQLQQGLTQLQATQQSVLNQLNSASTTTASNSISDKGTGTADQIYMAPNGRPVKIPANSSFLSVCIDPMLYPDGSLLGFKTPDGKRFVARIQGSGASHLFLGYYEANSDGTAYTANCYTDSLQLTEGQEVNVLVLYHKQENGKNTITRQNATCKISKEIKRIPLCNYSNNVPFDLAGLTLGSVVDTFRLQGCRNLEGPLEYYVNQGKLKEWLGKKGMSGAEIYVADCGKGSVTKVTSQAQEETPLTVEQAKTKVLSKNFTGDFAVFACIGENGKWTVETNFRNGVINPVHPKLSGIKPALEAYVKEQAKEEIAERNATTGGTGNGANKEERLSATDNAADGEFYKESMGMIEAVCAVYDFGKEIINEARMPQGVWDKQGHLQEFTESPFHAPPLLAGGGDQVIDEVTSGIQFIQLGYQVVRHPGETFRGMWTAVKKMKPSEIRKLIITDEAIANYNAGGDVGRHQGGKDGVRIAMTVFTVWKTAAKSGKDILQKGGNEIDDVINKASFDDVVRANMDEALDAIDADKMVKDCYEDVAKKEFLESASEELKDVAQTQGRKSRWTEILARFKRGNDFNAKVRNMPPPNPYAFYEVTVEHTLTNGSKKRYRLDSYNHGSEIVSRKATDLANIQQSTFEGYLRELVQKYPTGVKIVKPGTNIDGQLLSGNFKLEIPAGNANFSRLSEYRQIASNFTHNGQPYNIQIVLQSE